VIVPVPDWSRENVASVLPVLIDAMLPERMRFVLSPSVIWNFWSWAVSVAAQPAAWAGRLPGLRHGL
jgi:hypothetical protein